MGTHASGGFNLAQLPGLDIVMGLLGFTAAQKQAVLKAKDVRKQVTAFIMAFTKSGAKNAALKEPTNVSTGDIVSTIKSAIAALPDRQHLTAEVGKYITGATALIGILASIIAMAMGAWKLIEGGFAAFMELINRLIATIDPNTELGKTLESFNAALKQALEGADLKLEDLYDPKKLDEALSDVQLPPVYGVSDAPLPLGEALNRLAAQLPVIPTPDRPQPPNPDKPLTQTNNTTTQLDLGNGVTRTIQETTRVHTPVEVGSTDLVPSTRSTPPQVKMVDANIFRADPNPFKSWGNPVAALENDLALAADVKAAANQQTHIAETAQKLAEAAGELAANRAKNALSLALLALLKSLVVYNFQTGNNALVSETAGRSLRWWSSFVPPTLTVDPAIIAKITSGQALSPTEQADYDNALTTLTNKATSVSAINMAAFPGNLVWAALGDNHYAGTIEQLVSDIPELIAVAEGVSFIHRQELAQRINNLDKSDQLIETIPDLFLVGDPRVDDYASAVSRWCETLIYVRDLSPGTKAALTQLSDQVGGTALSFIDLVQTSTLDFDKLYSRLLRDAISYEDRQAVGVIADYWDSVVAVTSIDENSQDPIVVTFLTELLAAAELLPPASGMVIALDQIKDAVYTVGGPLGTDLHRLVAIVSGLLRCRLILASTLVEGIQESRVKTILEIVEALSDEVSRFPNPGTFGRIAEVLS